MFSGIVADILSLVICATLVTLAFVFILFKKVSKIKIDDKKIEDISGYITEYLEKGSFDYVVNKGWWSNNREAERFQILPRKL